MVKRIAILLIAFCLPAEAGLTLITREPFQGVQTFNSGNPGNLGTNIVGDFYARAGGPRVVGDTTADSTGWSADLRMTTGSLDREHVVSISGNVNTATQGVFSCWYYFGKTILALPNGTAFGCTRRSGGTILLQIITNPNVNNNFWYYDGGYHDGGALIPTNQWFELRHTWALTNSTKYNYTVNFRLAGSPTFSTIYLVTNGTFSSAPVDFKSGALNLNSYSYWKGRYGMPSLFSSTDYATDRTNLVSDVIDPVIPMNWYVNPDTGNDSNPGTSPSNSFKTADKVTVESANGGFFDSWAGYASGDTLWIDTATAPLDISR